LFAPQVSARLQVVLTATPVAIEAGRTGGTLSCAMPPISLVARNIPDSRLGCGGRFEWIAGVVDAFCHNQHRNLVGGLAACLVK
tara:strand:- start:89504 stop:89755 length:252 start_codon:yes stop_codon:yes gene_type:complete